jgi:hypothetical protein
MTLENGNNAYTPVGAANNQATLAMAMTAIASNMTVWVRYADGFVCTNIAPTQIQGIWLVK